MTIESDRETLRGLLLQSGIGYLPGKLLYSGLGTLKPGKLYLLGYNPGGDPAIERDSIASQLSNVTTDWNEYIDSAWMPRGIVQRLGTALLQKRIQGMLECLGLPTREVCASNLVFVRSEGINRLPDRHLLEKKCWPIHEWIISRVQPKLILTLGNDAFAALRNIAERVGQPSDIPSGHGDWRCYADTVELANRRYRIASIPHLSRYKIADKQNVLDWLRLQLA